MTFDPWEALSIEECQGLLQNVGLKTSLTFIRNTFTLIATTIEKLETRGLMISEVIDMVSKVENALKET